MPGADDWNVWGDVVGLLTMAVGLERGDPSVRTSLDDYLAGAPDAVGARVLAIADATARSDRDGYRQHLAVLDDVLPLDRLAWHSPLVLRHLGDAAARFDDAGLAGRLLDRARPFSGQLLVTYAATTVEGAADRVVGEVAAVTARTGMRPLADQVKS